MPVVLVLWTAFFVVNFNIAMMIPLLPFIQQDVGLSPGEAGLVLAAFPVTALVANLALGPFIDRYGRRRFLLAGALGCALIFLGTAAASSAWLIILGRALTGFFMPMIGASVFAAVADHIPPEGRIRAAGYVTSAAPVAFLLSMSMGAVLGGLLAWQVPLLILAALALGLAASVAALPRPPGLVLSEGAVTLRTYGERFLSLSLDRSTRSLLIAHLCSATAMFVFLGLYPSWLLQRALPDHGPGTVGTLLFLGEVGGLLGAVLAGRLSRWSRHPLMPAVVATLAAALVLLGIPLGTGIVAWQAAAYAVFAFARDLLLALLLGGIVGRVEAARRGTLNSVMNALYQTGASIGGVASALLYALRPDFGANALVAGGLFATASALLWSITRAERLR